MSYIEDMDTRLGSFPKKNFEDERVEVDLASTGLHESNTTTHEKTLDQ